MMRKEGVEKASFAGGLGTSDAPKILTAAFHFHFTPLETESSK